MTIVRPADSEDDDDDWGGSINKIVYLTEKSM